MNSPATRAVARVSSMSETPTAYTFVGGMRQPELPAQPDAQIEAMVHSELAALLGARGAPQCCAVTRWARAIPQYTLGHRARVAELEAAERALPGLFFRANYRGGISVGDCVASGRAAAETIASFLAATRRDPE